MSTQLFDKVITFTDLHLGKKSNSRQFNIDCLDFITWFIDLAKKENITKCICLGDFHDNRSSINVSTLNYSYSILEMLNDAFEDVWFITGNHDLFYREKRELYSFPYAEKFDNIHILNDMDVIGDVAFVPWLVGDEWKKIKKLKAKYMFGHFELPNFYLNSLIKMPDHGGLSTSDLNKCDYVFSGHFHKRQQQGNVIYTGNTFPHNFSDAWDDDRGAMILEWGGEPQYVQWEDAPKYKTIKLSTLIDSPDKYLLPKSYIRVVLDIPISYEESNYIKETFVEKYDIREISLVPNKTDDHSQEWDTEEIEFESVDKIVYNQLETIDSEAIDNKLLVDIYNKL